MYFHILYGVAEEPMEVQEETVHKNWQPNFVGQIRKSSTL